MTVKSLEKKRTSGVLMKKAVFPGCFDPVTKGHLDIIQRASKVFSELTVGVSMSFEKKPFFSVDERVDLLKNETQGLSNVKVMISEGLTVKFLKDHQAQVIVRGVRSFVDFRNEQIFANVNFEIDPQVETILFFSHPKYRDISSRTVKEMAFFGASFEKFVGSYTAQVLQSKMAKENRNDKTS